MALAGPHLGQCGSICLTLPRAMFTFLVEVHGREGICKALRLGWKLTDWYLYHFLWAKADRFVASPNGRSGVGAPPCDESAMNTQFKGLGFRER